MIQILAEIDTIVFDKTGTLTEGNKGKVRFEGVINKDEEKLIYSVVNQSVHPMSKMVAEYLAPNLAYKVTSFEEVKSKGLEAVVEGKNIRLGRLDFVKMSLQIKLIPKST